MSGKSSEDRRRLEFFMGRVRNVVATSIDIPKEAAADVPTSAGRSF